MRTFLGELLELAGAVVLIGAAVVMGVLFHRAALSLLLALVIGAGLLIYFANVYEDVVVHVKRPRLPRLRKPVGQTAPTEPAPGQVVRICGVCNMPAAPDSDHTRCNEVVARTMASMRRPTEPR